MLRERTGRYKVISTVGETVKAFIPAPLPPDPPVDLSGSRQRSLERATLALGQLDSITLLLPDPDIFLYSYVRREAVLSSQIEGTQSSLADLLLFELDEAPGVPLDDVKEVSFYVQAMNHGITRTAEGFPLSNRLIREMHGVLLASGRGSDKQPGEFRRSQNWISGTRPGNAHFVPPPPSQVEECMAALERFIHEDQSPYPTLVKAALAHAQFETIHPFLDGNGRIGRLLISFMLHTARLLSKPLLYLSLYFKERRSEYYSLLDKVRSDGDWEAWLDFFLAGVESTATNAVNTAKSLVEVFKKDEGRIRDVGRGASNTLRVFHFLRGRPITNLNEICKKTGISFPVATKGIEKLRGLGIVKELTGGKRNRVFAYGKYLDIIGEGTELI